MLFNYKVVVTSEAGKVTEDEYNLKENAIEHALIARRLGNYAEVIDNALNEVVES